MKNHRRKFLKLFGLAYLSVILFPYNLLYSATKKIINPDLTFDTGITIGIVIGIAIGLVFILITRQKTPK